MSNPKSTHVGGTTGEHVKNDGDQRVVESLPTPAGEALPHGTFNGTESNYDEDERMSQIKEILGHAAMPVLDKCELVAEWVRYAEAKLSVFGQIVPKPKGGRPEGGIARAARELPVRGKSPDARRKFIERAIKIHGIWPEAKSAVRTAGLDDAQTALLAIAQAHSLEAQLAKVEEIVDRKKAPRRNSSAREDGESASSLTEAERLLKAELARATERQRELEEELETARGMASLPPAVDASTNASLDLEIPPGLDHRPLGPEDQLKFESAMTAWASSTELRAAMVSASPVVLERFIAAVREEIASSASSRAG
jgi:hypothetical protein